MTYGTRHIRQMLAQAIDACEKADEIMADETPWIRSDERKHDVVQRLLMGASVNAQHAAQEINDERFRLRYGDDGYLKG